MAPILSLLSLLLFLTCSSFSSARSHYSKTTSLSSKPFKTLQGHELIKELNLHPKHDVNIFQANNSTFLMTTIDSRIVEKWFSLSVLGNSGASVHDLAQHAGYFCLQDTVDARMFYFFFESRNSKADPVVIWLTGGPGCSSELALFYENGPFHITKNLSFVWNDFGRDKVSNLIYVDQPTGTGFNYSSSQQGIRHDEKGVSNDLYNFLQENHMPVTTFQLSLIGLTKEIRLKKAFI